MYSVLIAVQIVVSVLLILSVLAQQRGSGLSATFGGTGGFYTSKRGAEKFLSIASIVFAVIFILNSLAFLFIGA